jgi:hypothetical protein
MAASVLKMVLGEIPLYINVESIAEGMGALLPLLNDIGEELQSAQEALLEQNAQRHIAAALEQAAAQKKDDDQK